MRGKSSPKSKNGVVEVDYLENLKQPELSGAYIRTLVKELTSSRTKDSLNNKVVENYEGESISSNQNSSAICDGFPNHKQESSPQQHKKQVRRRLHTSRPYQERLLNMAEARREIVAALKFHRAAMKQASEKQQQQQFESGPELPLLGNLSNPVSSEQEARLMSRRNPRIYASNSSTSSNFPINNLGHLSYSQGLCSPYAWPVSTIASPSLIQENLNFILPSQTLGLNLNLQDFNLLDTPCDGISKSLLVYSSSSASTSSSPASEEIPSMEARPPVVTAEVTNFGDSGLHQSMDDKEMAEIRSIGEQYQMEWNDTMNLVTSAWWLKFLKETKPEDEVMEYPTWLNANESCLHDLNDCCSDEYLQEPALPCMDIEEIEGMDDDWLA
ncbi:circadian locomoter output cycles protein kaput [Dorcoceras hygrometricum]|uniref:Circadian locomoter output cycles protein kaput n=1 Tax=Dorcoceras hygrometricum TaxID=472368 RepID=A0A2Z7BZV7_9LAMI|nr:circadian locomoter output cycles protein kaput [Dorcoceras hygrometricum]